MVIGCSLKIFRRAKSVSTATKVPGFKQPYWFADHFGPFPVLTLAHFANKTGLSENSPATYPALGLKDRFKTTCPS